VGLLPAFGHGASGARVQRSAQPEGPRKTEFLAAKAWIFDDRIDQDRPEQDRPKQDRLREFAFFNVQRPAFAPLVKRWDMPSAM
jgi:hypothetical protein